MIGSGRNHRILSRAALLLVFVLSACRPQPPLHPPPATTIPELPPPAPAKTAASTPVIEAESPPAVTCTIEEIEEKTRPGTDQVAATLPPPDPPALPELIDEYPPPPPGYRSVASYYAKKFNGRRTCTGERYDPEKLTAASNDLPLGSRAIVRNPRNGKEVTVRINDRPRKRSYPLIDLSRAAARELGFLGKGAIRVRVIPLAPLATAATPSH